MKRNQTNSAWKLSKSPFPVVGIGASAGGLDAFKKLVQSIPEKSGMAYILVQHLHPDYESALPEILQRETKIPVVEISDKVQVEPNYIYVIPPKKLLTASDGILNLNPRPENNNLPIDLFFSSLAEVHGTQSIGVILSGTGYDGKAGLEDIKKHGGLTFAQAPETASYKAMPENAITAEIIDFVLPPEKIVPKLKELQQTYRTLSPQKQPFDSGKIHEDGFRRVLTMLKVHLGVDFNFYKQTTIRKRIIRRMMILRLSTINEYQQYLKENMTELDLLFHDLLIQVTSFFRDPEAYHALFNKILPEIIKTKPDDGILRIWVPACATGQEAYTIAICLADFLSTRSITVKVKIFATDISEQSIAKARSGIYTEAEVKGVSEDRLKQFFNKSDGHYQLTKQIRDMCIFAVHNFLKDPPFAKMNLISCRNVLIYFEPFLQKKALTLFHYALKDEGYLMLGKSENVSNVPEFFNVTDEKNKFFICKSSSRRFMNVLSGNYETKYAVKHHFSENREDKADDYQKCADKDLLSKYAPVGVVVDDQLDIVQFRGATGTYLEPSPGKASLNVLKMAREGLGFEIRNALLKAKSTGEACSKYGLPIEKGNKSITLEVIPLLNTVDLHYLILFKEETSGSGMNSEKNENSNLPINTKSTDRNNPHVIDNLIEQLENELTLTRKEMLRISEAKEVANEELQSANEELKSLNEELEASQEKLQSISEELISGSEELQNIDEELEASKEELQSTNEELITINQELYDRIDQLNQARKFSDSIISILHEPLLLLDRNFIIKRANGAFYKNFELTEEKILGKDLFGLQDNTWAITGLAKELFRIREGKQQMTKLEVEHTFPIIGTRTILFNIQMMDSEKPESLVLLALNDITERKNVEKLRLMVRNMEQNSEMLNNLYLNSPAFMCTLLGTAHIYDLVNPAYQELVGKRQLVGIPIIEALPELKDQGLDIFLDNVYKTGRKFVGIQRLAWLAYDEGLSPEERYFNISYQPMYDKNKKINGILCFGYEVTMEVLAKKENEKNLRLILESIPLITFAATSEGKIIFFNQYALDYSGLSIEQATTGKGWEKIIFPEELLKIIMLTKNCLATQEDFYKEIRLKRHSDQKYRWHLLRATHIKEGRNGGIATWVGVATDIHEQKIKEQNKDEFINIASHEMKTPLTSAKGYLQLLQMMLNGNNSEAALLVGKALNSITRLNSLITELLEVNKIQHGKLNYTLVAFDFNNMLDEALEDQRNASPDYTILKEGNISPPVTGDRERLQQVVINLLSNAIKYSPEQKKIVVTAKEKNGDLIFSVKDQGIGISKDNLEKIFKRYYRVEDQATHFQGMGIGLYISNEIIKRHGGNMWVESEKDNGSTFYFSIPVKRQS